MRTEFAGASRTAAAAYMGLAQWAGTSLANVVEHAEAGRLGELVEARSLTRPVSGAEALRVLERKRYPPGDRPKSPSALIGELRAKRLIWQAEEAERGRQIGRRDPFRALAELAAKRKRWGL